MKKRKLIYRFYNPNSAVATADYILKIFVEVNQEKVQLSIQSAADMINNTVENKNNGHSA